MNISNHKKNSVKIPASWLMHPWHCISLGFGSGLMPFAPGTWGTLVAIPIAYLCSYLGQPLYLLVTALVCLLGIYTAGYTSEKLKVHDHSGIVVDEIAGYMITMIGVTMNATSLLVGFLLFRLFDILKPWPIRIIDRNMKGGLGIMMDDILAGVFSLIIMQLLIARHWL